MVRQRMLAQGWYPSTADGVVSQCEEWERATTGLPRDGVAAVVPHAGWAFSGRIAYQAMRGLRRDAETVVVVGGHLRPSDAVRVAPEDGYETPLGILAADVDLAAALGRSIDLRDDRIADNTVEIQLPLVAHLFPDARCLHLRCPPDENAARVGELIAGYAIRTGRIVCVVGSTDLTHYGPGYGFTPVGLGEGAVEWVRTVNDRRIVEAMVSLDSEATVRLGTETGAACSAGAAAAAIAFARAFGVREGTVTEYAQSYDVRPDDSFVGYVGIRYAPAASSSA
jgi:MEMO1 family protein